MSETTTTVTVTQGVLRGREETSKCGKTYYSFRGIPYAKPPVGPLRFKAPQPPESWEGIRDALVEGAPSPHTQNFVDEGFKGDEDCLYLNLYTPKLPDGGQTPLKAVMFFIHGGGFNNGSGTSEFYGPDYILQEDVVVVTINYRLGALGFLSTGDSVLPGNNGLKDQAMALRWIQQNVAQFGGNPTKVAIFGESAGAASVQYHMLSPMSKGLFSRAIAQSGAALNPWAFNTPPAARSKAFRFGEALGCKTNDSKELVDFLSSIPPQQLVEGVTKAMTEEERDLGTVYFRPTVEQGNGEDVFLPAEPIDLITRGKFHNVPFIAGINSSEGLICLKEVMAKPAVLKKYDSQFELLIPRNLTEGRDPEKVKEIVQKVKKYYFGDSPVSQETLFQYVDLSSDSWFVNGINSSVKLHSAHSSAPVFCYQFSFDGRLGFLKRLIGAFRFPGVCHCDELGYLFCSPFLDIDMDPGCPEDKIRTLLIKMWTNFAKTGNPSLPEVRWESVTESNQCYLNIDIEPQMCTHLMKERMTFWEELNQVYLINKE